jgi:Uma2 family endonuclease
VARKPKSRLGPIHHGRPVTDSELAACEFVGGFRYEVIDGRLYVSVRQEPWECLVEQWLYDRIALYADRRPDQINYVSLKARVFVHARRRETIPEPDVTAYRDVPLHLPLRQLHWRNVSPVLVAEGFSGRDPEKDLIRNVQLYLEVPTIREYWIVNGSEDPERPSLIVYRRRGRRWQRPIEVGYRETYTTPLLPGFRLRIDPRR